MNRQLEPAGRRSTELLELRGVSVANQGRLALEKISLSIPHGAQAAVVGPNGAGKSTLFKAMVGLLPVSEGEILIHGRPPSEYRDPVAYLPQREEVDWRFPVTVWDVVAMGRFGRRGWLRRLGQEDRLAVRRSLEELGIADLAAR
ncbi:MAG: ATP-binding cassette domain-containing protein, partial [Thermoleophilia bacterium]|nr:ATP-binding cassette domain-containing protein [Thermoleophilia bacterium]